MAVRTMQDLLIDELRDIYHAEKQLVKALPKMAKAAQADELRQAFQRHLETTQGQIERLEQAFDQLQLRVRGKRCEAMAGLIEEANELMDEVEDPSVRDAALIAAAQKAEHYEISAYGTVITHANELGHSSLADLLKQTLSEEKETDAKLTQLAEARINKEAVQKQPAAQPAE